MVCLGGESPAAATAVQSNARTAAATSLGITPSSSIVPTHIAPRKSFLAVYPVSAHFPRFDDDRECRVLRRQSPTRPSGYRAGFCGVFSRHASGPARALHWPGFVIASRADGEDGAVADQRPEDHGRAAAGREEGRSGGAHAGPRPDAHAGALAEVLGEVPHPSEKSPRAPRRHAADQAGRAHRAPEGVAAAEGGAAAGEAPQADLEGRPGPCASPRRDGGGRAPDLALRVTRALVVVNPAAGGGRTARAWRRLRDLVDATLPAEHAET